MLQSLRRWWMHDVPLHTFVFCNFLIGIPFFAFNTYVIYQLQVVGYLIGNDGNGMPCTTFCIVPWGSTHLDLNSVLLYLNALSFGIGGALTLLMSAYSDFWSYKHFLVTFFIVCYGAFSIPAYWLQDTTIRDFQVLTGLYVAFNLITLILIAVLNIYIPHCMRTSTIDSDQEEKPAIVEGRKRKYGFLMANFGAVGVAGGGIIMFIIVIILSQTLTGAASQSSGLLVTTIVGFITVAGSLVAFFGLPAIPTKSTAELKGSWTTPLIEFWMPFKDLLVRKNAAALLISYTIYTDTTFAISSAISQLFVAEIHPAALEYSLYALAQPLSMLISTLGFIWLQPRVSIKLETWLITGYCWVLILPIWACIGLANVDFGFKLRWEFYVQLFIGQLSQAFANTAFRVLFAEMIPVGNEVRWFGMQLVLSCATVWVNYVASSPLQNTTHQLRFPLVLSLLFMVVAVVIELCRTALPVFRADLRKWELSEGRSVNEKDEMSELDGGFGMQDNIFKAKTEPRN